MEKTQKDLLKEFQEEIARLKEQIETLEARLSSLQASPVQADDEEVDFTDIQIGVAEMPDQVGHDEPAPEPEAVPEPVVAPEPEPVVAPEPEAPKVSAPQPAEDDTAHLPWRTDKPGIPVKNIRSGISLLDRALFIGTLFKEDFALYDQTIADLNAMSNLDEAVAYIREKFPHWNLKSDVVYHFMMSVRKKLG
jgi:hypothetical protein